MPNPSKTWPLFLVLLFVCGAPALAQQAPRQPVAGMQPLLVIPAYFASEGKPANADEYLAAGLQGLGTANLFFEECSSGRMRFSGADPTTAPDLLDWVALPIEPTLSPYLIQRAVIHALDPVVDFRKYRHLAILGPFGFAGHATVGSKPIPTRDGVVSLGTIWLPVRWSKSYVLWAHELGHTLGLVHAHSPVHQPNAPLPHTPQALFAELYQRAYGNPFSMMGSGRGHFAAPEKELLGWLDGIQSVTESGTYVLQPLESVSSGIQALRIPRPGGSSLYVEYRQPIGFDAALDPAAFEGALILQVVSHQNFILDATPEDGTSRDLTLSLPVGRSWTDPRSGVTITVRAQNSGGETNLTVEVLLR